jgi:hypothetical protein
MAVIVALSIFFTWEFKKKELQTLLGSCYDDGKSPRGPHSLGLACNEKITEGRSKLLGVFCAAKNALKICAGHTFTINFLPPVCVDTCLLQYLLVRLDNETNVLSIASSLSSVLCVRLFLS